jgi:hypothetical protein
MKRLIIGLLAAVLTLLLTAAMLTGYRQDQQVIRWFPGTGIAGKIDIAVSEPRYVLIENRQTGAAANVRVLSDGTFIAPLAPGVYRLKLANDERSINVRVPNGDCVDLVLDYRLPVLVLKVPREGWPIPQLA